MSNDRPPQMMTNEQLETITSALTAEVDGEDKTVYKNPTDVPCPDAQCDEAPFDALIVSESGWETFGAESGGVSVHFTTVGSKSLLFIHEA